MASAPMPTSFLLRSSRPSLSPWPAIFRAWLPVLLFAALLALESTAAFGANRTSAPLHRLLHAILGPVVDRNWPLLHFLIRKIGHFLGYGLFSCLCYRGFRLVLRRAPHPFCPGSAHSACHALAVAAAFLAACGDELHQSFLANRTGSFHDVLLDTAGALALQLALLAAQSLLRAVAGPPDRPANASQPGSARALPLAA